MAVKISLPYLGQALFFLKLILQSDERGFYARLAQNYEPGER